MRHRNLVVQFVKFGIVGVSNTLIALGVYYLILYLGGNYIFANFLSWVISVFNAYYWNNRYVFKNDKSWLVVLVKTYVSYGGALLLSTAGLYFLVDNMGISDKIAPVLVFVITVPANFVINKFWTFR